MTKKVSKPSLEFTLNASFLCFFVDIGQYLLKLFENFVQVQIFWATVYVSLQFTIIYDCIHSHGQVCFFHCFLLFLTDQVAKRSFDSKLSFVHLQTNIHTTKVVGASSSEVFL